MSKYGNRISIDEKKKIEKIDIVFCDYFVGIYIK